MHHYLTQLLADIAHATEHADHSSTASREMSVPDWVSSEEEDKTAPMRSLEVLTGIQKEQLPPHEMLSDDQVHELLEALKKMLDEYNWSFVLQTVVPDRIQYDALRDNFDQQVRIKQWHYGFFELCRPNTEHGKCALKEYCECAFFSVLIDGFIDEEETPEEERAHDLEIEIHYLKKKYESDWMKYYPYHLDKDYDDENGEPYNYGLDDEEDDDNWWRR